MYLKFPTQSNALKIFCIIPGKFLVTTSAVSNILEGR